MWCNFAFTFFIISCSKRFAASFLAKCYNDLRSLGGQAESYPFPGVVRCTSLKFYRTTSQFIVEDAPIDNQLSDMPANERVDYDAWGGRFQFCVLIAHLLPSSRQVASRCTSRSDISQLIFFRLSSGTPDKAMARCRSPLQASARLVSRQMMMPSHSLWQC